MQVLSTTSDVIAALGGTRAVADLTHRTYNAAYNWRYFDAFPSNTFLVMQAALRAKNIDAPASLWGIREPENAA